MTKSSELTTVRNVIVHRGQAVSLPSNELDHGAETIKALCGDAPPTSGKRGVVRSDIASCPWCKNCRCCDYTPWGDCYENIIGFELTITVSPTGNSVIDAILAEFIAGKTFTGYASDYPYPHYGTNCAYELVISDTGLASGCGSSRTWYDAVAYNGYGEGDTCTWNVIVHYNHLSYGAENEACEMCLSQYAANFSFDGSSSGTWAVYDDLNESCEYETEASGYLSCNISFTPIFPDVDEDAGQIRKCEAELLSKPTVCCLNEELKTRLQAIVDWVFEIGNNKEVGFAGRTSDNYALFESLYNPTHYPNWYYRHRLSFTYNPAWNYPLPEGTPHCPGAVEYDFIITNVLDDGFGGQYYVHYIIFRGAISGNVETGDYLDCGGGTKTMSNYFDGEYGGCEGGGCLVFEVSDANSETYKCLGTGGSVRITV